MLMATLGHGAWRTATGASRRVVPATQMPRLVRHLAWPRRQTAMSGSGPATPGSCACGATASPNITEGLPDLKINCLLAGKDGELLDWHRPRRCRAGLAREVTTAGVPDAAAAVPALAMMRDRESNIWIAAGARGLLRVNRDGGVGARRTRPRLRGNVTAVFEDRDGNLWVGTTGRDRALARRRLRHATRPSQGLPSDAIGPACTSMRRAGRGSRRRTGACTGCATGVSGTSPRRGLRDDVVYSIGGGDDEVWVGRQRGGLDSHPRAGRDGFGADRFTRPTAWRRTASTPCIAPAMARVWAGTLSAGVSRYKDGALHDLRHRPTAWPRTPWPRISRAPTARCGSRRRTASARSHAEGGVATRLATGLPSNDVNVLLRGLARAGVGRHDERPCRDSTPATSRRRPIAGRAARGRFWAWPRTRAAGCGSHRRSRAAAWTATAPRAATRAARPTCASTASPTG